ncbi:MAG TPA: flagellar hook-basal body protein [Candidatus Atribacteria bacterium]|nr:flagellar hook-basal body protein [Candidatus Atribacteria bacterium]HPT78023.1 flagellar hook-basal body protein [Candidatus Atribacteria bacterium]
MFKILHTGRTSMDAMQRRMDSIANNIANAQTTGYKSQRVEFEDLVYDRLADRGVPQTEEARQRQLEIGTGSRAKDLARSFEPGILKETHNTYDLAIDGEGFFGLVDGNGGFYLTRDGAFRVDAEGRLTDSHGYYVVMDAYAPLSQYNDEDVTISGDGLVTANKDGVNVVLGRIRLFSVADKGSLTAIGGNMFAVRNGTEVASNLDTEGFGIIRQGFLEESNVDLTEELVNMLATQRAYELNTKSITAADEMWGMVNQLKR